MEILIIIPVFVAQRAEATTLEVLLDEVDDVLKYKRLEASLVYHSHVIIISDCNKMSGS